MHFGIVHHAVDLVFREAAGSDDGDLLFTARAFITRRNVDNAVGVNVERDLDLRHTTRGWRNAIKDEAPQRAVVLGKLALTLQDIDLHTRLAVACR